MVFGISKRLILSDFNKFTCAVIGAKGTGKGLFVSWVIRKRKLPHYSNCEWFKAPLEYSTTVKPLSFISISPNTFKNFLDNSTIKIPKVWGEGMDYYFDESNTQAPSFAYKELDKMPLIQGVSAYMAYSRHISNSNVHIMGQIYEKTFDKLREHAERFYYLRGSFVLGRLAITWGRYYDEALAFEERVLPFSHPFFLAASPMKAQYEIFKSKYGNVKRFCLFQILPRESFDTRYFHKVLFGFPAPVKTKKKKKEK